MDVVGSEIGQKMRSAIKAKLTELGCYVDDELPDYVMVMVANKRTRAQMEDDLQLFLGDNTELFVNWLHQVLKKLQEVTVTAPLKADLEKKNEKSKEKKEKKVKEKSKKAESSKKSKKKEKEKKARKKEVKKSSKSKKKSKHEMIRPNIPPLLMNIEKESEPSITDVFAGQILKNHGITLESYKDDPKQVETKAAIKELKRPIVPIIDPATISSQLETATTSENNQKNTDELIENAPSNVREDNIKEMNKIEAKIQGLRQKLVEQLDSMSDDEDFLNIRTEAEELMNDFAEDVFQEISQPPPVTPPLHSNKTLTPIQQSALQKPKDIPKEPETLPQIELNLPKRPIRERLGAREAPSVQEVKENEATKIPDSPERFTPEKEIEFRPQARSARSRLGSQSESQRKLSVSEENPEKTESSSKRLTSKVSQEARSGGARSCASVVRVRPRPRVGAPASSLLLRAVADAHKSLLNIPPKVDHETQKVKRALVLPMRRSVEAQKIVIQVPVDTHLDSQGDAISMGDMDNEGDVKNSINTKKDEQMPPNITKVINNTEYTQNRTANRQDGDLMETITIHNTTVDKDKGTQFIVTMDGYHPNAFLAKKLMTEGILDDDVAKEKSKEPIKPKKRESQKQTKENVVEKPESNSETATSINLSKKRLSNTSEESDTQVIIKQEQDQNVKKKKESTENTETVKELDDSPPVKKRKASPIVFDVDKKDKEKEKDRVRERTVSASSDSLVTLTTNSNTHKYDDLPPLSQAERKSVWCRTFPLCRFGSSCAFQHPRCKFAAACTRRGCVYSHVHAAHVSTHTPHVSTHAPHVSTHAPHVPPTGTPLLASHVVPAANYKTISAMVPPSMCKFYPNCVNPACHYYHPKPCRFGKACTNKLECNFYHNDIPAKWKYSL